MTTTDIEALVAWLRVEAAEWETEGEPYENGLRSPTAQKLRDAADALERQQADIQKKDEAFESAVEQISEYGARMDNMEAVVRVVRSMDRRGLLGKELRDALAALDGTPEGEG